MSLVELTNVVKRYGTNTVLDGVSLASTGWSRSRPARCASRVR